MPATNDGGPVSITYSANGGNSVTEYFDFLIVACDPRALEIADRSPVEAQVVEKLSSFSFSTSLWRSKRPNPAKYAARFHPENLESATGVIHGFRDETMAHSGAPLQSDPKHTFVTAYQLKQSSLIGADVSEVTEEFKQIRDDTMADREGDNIWLDFDPVDKAQPEEVHVVDYFPHFNSEDLKADWPWKIMDIQGENRTLYVSAHTCFESVLHIYLYAEQIMGREKVRLAFPEDKKARFAIVGAGPSGILFASQHLASKDYNNYKIFESTDYVGGKTLTKYREAPTTGKLIPCEMGTCYLSANYFPMYHLFEDYDAGDLFAFDKEKDTRSVMDPEIAKDQDERDNGVEFEKWTATKNGPNIVEESIKLALASVRYLILHYAIMGTGPRDAMPDKPPSRKLLISTIAQVFRTAAETWDAADDDEDCDCEVEAEDLLRALPTAQPAEAAAEELKKRGAPADVNALAKLVTGATLSKTMSKISYRDMVSSCDTIMETTFADFLDQRGMGSLKALFVYAYSVQGYGSIYKIPAYYGLVWVTPFLIQFYMMAKTPFADETSEQGTTNIATEGWLKLWTQMVDKHNMTIQTNAKITKITRS